MANNVEISNDVFVEKKQLGKILTFWSPQVGSGSTFILYNAARMLASQGHKVCMIDLDLRTPSLTKTLNTKDTLHFLDNLLPHAEVGNVSKEVFDSYVQSVGNNGNLFFIAGNNNVDQAMDIQMNGLEYIIKRAAEDFEYVLVDTNAYVDNAGTYAGLYLADIVYMLIEKKIQAIHTIDYSKELLAPLFNKFTLVINKVDKNILLSSSEVEKYFGKNVSYEIYNLGVEYINNENIGRGEQFLQENKKAKLFKDSIAHLIQETIQVDVTDKSAKKKGLFGKK